MTFISEMVASFLGVMAAFLVLGFLAA